MAEEKSTGKPARKARTLEEEIARAEAKLRKLQELHREQQRKERERNQKAVLEIIKGERLDLIPADKWRDALPKIRALLIAEEEARPTDRPHLSQAVPAGADATAVSQ